MLVSGEGGSEVVGTLKNSFWWGAVPSESLSFLDLTLSPAFLLSSVSLFLPPPVAQYPVSIATPVVAKS